MDRLRRDGLFLYIRLLVRFFGVIGQPPALPHVACPILPRYRTTSNPSACCLSDSPPISDNLQPFRMLLVQFFPGIGQPSALSDDPNKKKLNPQWIQLLDLYYQYCLYLLEEYVCYAIA